MIKRVGVCLISLFVGFLFAGCNALVDVPDESGQAELPALTIEGDKMCGFFITFYDKDGNALTSEDFDDDSAVKYYMERKKFDSPYHYDSYYYETQVGLAIWSEGKSAVDVSDKKSGLTIDMTIPYTSELLNSVMVINGVYNDEEGQRCYAEFGGMGHTLQDFGSGSGTITQTLTASRTNTDGTKEEISYVCSVTIRYELIDDLTGVKVLEYGADNALLASHRYVKGSGPFTAGEDCAYVVVEKEYTVVHDYEHNTVKYQGMTYCEREIVERPLIGRAPSSVLLYPRGDGFVDKESLNIIFA